MRGYGKKFDKGIAMPIVIAIMAIIFLFCATVLTLNENLTRNVAFSSARERALHIAEAGYNRFLYELNDDSSFYKINKGIGVPYHEFVVAEEYTAADNPEWDKFPKKYEVMEYREGPKLFGYFQIELVPPSPLEPVLTVISTGWTAENPEYKKTIKVQISKRTFSRYVVFDGDAMGAPWGSSSHIRGPYFSNNNLYTSGSPTFYDEVGYVKDIVPYPTQAKFLMPGQPQKKSQLIFPPSSSELRKWAEGTEYLFKGRTCILIEDSKLKVRNKVIGDKNELVLDLPSKGVVYVDGDLFIAGKLDGRLTVGASGNIYICTKDPTKFNEAAGDFDPANAAEMRGLVYANENIPRERKIEPGMTDDMLGLITDGDIIVATRTWPSAKIVNGITTKDSPNQVVKKSQHIEIYAAMMARGDQSDFHVEYLSSLGDYGYIYFNGSLATQKSGATYQTSGGSVKGYRGDYTFDYRMLYEAPPHYLEPQNSGWEVKSWEEIDDSM